jgi:exopolysaccharide biosynthesis protein
MHSAPKLWLTLIFAACIPSCTPIPKTYIPTHPSSPPSFTHTIPQPKISRPAIPAHPVSPPKVVSKTLSNIQFQGVAFDSRSHALKPIDQTNGPGSQYLSARDCADKQQALLAINAGFFNPEGNPLGLVISQGKHSGSWNSSSSLGTGIYRIDSSGIASISRRTQASAVSNSKELLQAGPLLIENHKPITGLDPSKVAMRSILLHDGGHRWWIGTTSPCSLADLSQVLYKQSPADWKISHALNLDGGRSTDLFVSSKISGVSLERKSLMNRQVRNFLILK